MICRTIDFPVMLISLTMNMKVAIITDQVNNTIEEQAHRVVVTSVGIAVPASAVSVARGLGIPVARVVKAFYRAPAILVDNISQQIAEDMARLLEGLGYQAKAEDQLLPFDVSRPLLDVAVYIEDTSRYTEIISATSKFIGVNNDEAARLISTPPGIVLGSVSSATVEALEDRLGGGVSVIASDPVQAIYDLYLVDCEELVAQRIITDLKHKGHNLVAKKGCLLAGLSQQEAKQIWQQYEKLGVLCVINRDFMRFDIVLQGPKGQNPSSVQIKALNSIVGIPADLICDVFTALPITLIEGMPYADIKTCLEKLAESGLEVRSDMITFLQLGLRIISSNEGKDLGNALTDMGILKNGEMLPSFPYQLPYHLPELQARLLRDTLIASGANTVFTETVL